ncbi:MAG TPA: DUF4126 family protein [Candidatus Sulfopaludibacter sp.]|nr:DUF4126 family protein [Candidatus Sulfopaludibacter sp.]
MFLLSLLIGVMDGLRSMNAPAVVAWAAHLHWIDLDGTPLAFMGSTVAVAIFTVMAVVELVADQLPNTPARTKPPGLIARIVLGALCGACLAVAARETLAIGACLGAAGGVIGAFGGYEVRTRTVKALGVRDLFVALAEDAVAIGGSILIVSLVGHPV